MGKTSTTAHWAGRFGWMLAAPLLLLGCNDHPLQPLDKIVTSANLQAHKLPQKTKIDFLFVIDNSGSMCEEQENLTRNFSLFSEFLAKDLGSAADYRIAVTSTDLRTPGHSGAFQSTPALPMPSQSCRDPITNEPKSPDTADCADLLDAEGRLEFGPIIKSGDGIQGGNIEGDTPEARQADLERRFRCMATLGTGGDTFEKGLEAMRLALSCDGPNKDLFGSCCVDGRYDPTCFYNPGEAGEPEFLRPDAALVVVFITDEADCSDPASNPAASKRAICKYGPADGDGDGIPNGYADQALCPGGDQRACFQRECGGLAAADCYTQRCAISRSDNYNCEWHRDSLTPVDDYEDFLLRLKSNPAQQLVVASIAGLRAFTPSGAEVTYNLPARPSDPTCDPRSPLFDADKSQDECCPGGRCEGEPEPTCESANGIAFNGRRYLDLAERFGINGIGCTAEQQLRGDPACVHICTDDFSDSLKQVRDKVAEIVSIYCLDKRPACFVRRDANGERLETPRACATPEEFGDVANYQIAVTRGCRGDDVGQECRDQLATLCSGPEGDRCEASDGGSNVRIRYGRSEYELDPAQSSCPSGFMLRLTAPPPAGSEVVLEFQVDLDGRGAPRADEPAADAGVADAAPSADAGE